MNQQDSLKQLVGQTAAKLVKNGMIVGLGTGSTVRFLVDALGKRVQEEGLAITGVTTSNRTTAQATSLGIKIVDLDDVDRDFYGIKGGGGALLWEKIVNDASTNNVWIVDQSKVVDRIGAFGVPVEVIPFGASKVFAKFKHQGYQPQWRTDEAGQLYRTDENNYIIDLKLGPLTDPLALAEDLINTVGVVEHGLFLNRVNQVIVGNEAGITTLTAP